MHLVKTYLTNSHTTTRLNIDQAWENNISTILQEKYEAEDTTISNTSKETNPDFSGGEQTGTPVRVGLDDSPLHPEREKYVFVLYCYDVNAIIREPRKARTGKEILSSYKKHHEDLEDRWFIPKTYWVENEASEALKIFDRQQ